MTTQPDNVLFDKAEKSKGDEDVWDDQALIKAYDRSVRLIKKAISNKANEPRVDRHLNKSRGKDKKTSVSTGTEEGTTEDDDLLDQSDSDTLESDSNEAEGKWSPIHTWHEGDLCMAVYTEDNIIYPASIVKIFTDNEGEKNFNKCIVRYLYYNNEEKKRLSELIEYKDDDKDEEQVEAANLDETDLQPADVEGATVISKPAKSQSKSLSHHKNRHTGSTNNKPSAAGVAYPTALTAGFAIPPPPPMPPLALLKAQLTQGDVSSDDALHSMLMSWYMSGYHTGFYYALSQQKRRHKESKVSKKY